jgi:hydrogenase maturation protease
MARAMNIEVKNVLLVGCEPATLGGEEGQMGLSAPVEAAVDEAVKLVESLINEILDKRNSGQTTNAVLRRWAGFNTVNILR